jgi:hypothetical protein
MAAYLVKSASRRKNECVISHYPKWVDWRLPMAAMSILQKGNPWA